MIHFTGRGILLDIEGTTSSIAFVYDVLFPFARRHLTGFVDQNWNDAEVIAVREQIAHDADESAIALDRAALIAEVNRLMDGDVKATGLKQLQGLIWQHGYASGELRSHVYSDVPDALRRWNDARLDVRIFSSGSVAAQHLFFAHTEAGDLLGFLNGHYDTTTGPKREPDSYRAIARDFGLPPDEILFVSDVIEELDAAMQAAMHVALAVRPGNKPVPDNHGLPVVDTFDQIKIA